MYFPSSSCQVNAGYCFETKIIKIDVTSSNVEVIKNITLQEKSFSLEEVIITADKAISVKKDTVVFSAKHFLTGEEQSVEDLLANFFSAETLDDKFYCKRCKKPRESTKQM